MSTSTTARSPVHTSVSSTVAAAAVNRSFVHDEVARSSIHNEIDGMISHDSQCSVRHCLLRVRRGHGLGFVLTSRDDCEHTITAIDNVSRHMRLIDDVYCHYRLFDIVDRSIA
jgi:hypothetical protein